MDPLKPVDLARFLAGFRYRFTSERELQEGIRAVLQPWDATFASEYRLTARDRPDFFVAVHRRQPGEDLAPGIAIEVKVKGTAAQLLTQVHRYLQHDDVVGVVVVTSIFRHQLPDEISGKPVAVLHVSQAL